LLIIKLTFDMNKAKKPCCDKWEEPEKTSSQKTSAEIKQEV